MLRMNVGLGVLTMSLLLAFGARAASTVDTLLLDSVGKATVCRAVADLPKVEKLRLERTFHQDFSVHTLKDGQWKTHFQGSSSWPEALYWGGKHSNVKRQHAEAGEQQIYIDPQYRGLSDRPLGIDPFSYKDGALVISARRIPDHLRDVLFGNEYTSGLLTTSGWFQQLYGYFEIEARLPFGQALWPAFWLLPSDTSWPPEIDVFEGRGQMHGTLAQTTHWIDPADGKRKTCSINSQVPDADTAFHTYGVLWQPEGITYFIDRAPVYQITPPPGFDKPMYMLINIAIGSTVMHGVGQVTTETPDPATMEIKKVSAYRIERKE